MNKYEVTILSPSSTTGSHFTTYSVKADSFEVKRKSIVFKIDGKFIAAFPTKYSIVTIFKQ